MTDDSLASLGLALGAATAAIIAMFAAQPLVLPAAVLVGGPAVSVIVGAIAGLQPAIRASRLSPTAALRAI